MNIEQLIAQRYSVAMFGCMVTTCHDCLIELWIKLSAFSATRSQLPIYHPIIFNQACQKKKTRLEFSIGIANIFSRKWSRYTQIARF